MNFPINLPLYEWCISVGFSTFILIFLPNRQEIFYNLECGLSALGATHLFFRYRPD
ncbi:hypothetical protein ES703_56630 [subsurface metagenome]